MKRMTIVLAALSAAALVMPNAVAQDAAPEVNMFEEAEGLQRFILRPSGSVPGALPPTIGLTARLDGSSFPSLNLFSDQLHSAEYVLSKAEDIELTDAQRRRIIDIEAESQARLTRQRLENEGSDSQLDALLAEHPIDVDAALAELDRLLETERGPKREQLATLIAIRNVLSKSQVDKLADLREPFRIQFLEKTEFIQNGENILID